MPHQSWTFLPHLRAAGAIWLGFVSACSTAAADPAPDAPDTFLVVSPTRGADVEQAYVGQVQAARHIELRARASGVVEAIAVDEGQVVEAGQVLIRINARGAQLERERATAAVASAAAELDAVEIERASTALLAERGVVSATELRQATAKVAVVAAQLEEAKAAEKQATVRAELAVIRAPFTGVLGRLPHKVGSVVDEEQLLTTLTDASETLVYFKASEQEYLALNARGPVTGRAVRFLKADGVEHEVPGVIDAVDSTFDTTSGSIALRARLKNDSGALRHGNTGKVVLTERWDDALVIPQRATFEQQDQTYVYVVDNENVVHAQRITPRTRSNGDFILDGGLAVDARIVLEGIQHLRDGARIAVRPHTKAKP
jgi:membrane fusion protein (multidrug efflux system)